MCMTFVDLLIAILATWQIVEIWHHSYIMATARARASIEDNWIGHLLACPFCLSVWVAWFTSVVTLMPLPTISDNWVSWVLFGLLGGAKLAVIGFAVARGANLGNDLSHKWCRTPKEDQIKGIPASPDGSCETEDEGAPVIIKIYGVVPHDGPEKPDV